MINGIQLTVSLARKQPQIEPINDASSSAVWSTLATSQSQKGNHKDKRELVVYDDVFAWILIISCHVAIKRIFDERLKKAFWFKLIAKQCST